jgi:hypothetical protein
MMIPALMLLLAAVPAEVPRLVATPEPAEEFCVDCCNLYCAAAPTLSVSRHLKSQGRVSYDATRLEDGHKGTAWVASNGVSEWFQFEFRPGEGQSLHSQLGVNEVYILNGYAKSPSHWREHSRAKDLDLLVDGAVQARISLLDDAKPQLVALPNIPLHPHLTLRFVVVSVYPGEKFQEMALSEVRLDGYGAH